MRSIGIIGGGQLGRMTIEEARKYLARVEVLSPDYPSPASELADAVHVGDLNDFESVLEFAEELDVISYEIEGVSVPALRELERRGKAVLPAAGILSAIRDKYVQKKLFAAAGIPTARFALVEAPLGAGVPARSGAASPIAVAPIAAALAEAVRVLGGFRSCKRRGPAATTAEA